MSSHETTFSDRHIGPSAADQAEMLRALGYDSVEELLDETIPKAIRSDRPLALPAARSEEEAQARLAELADRNEPMTSLIGMGYHGTITPAVIRRNVLENPAWYTAYTPYQPEISQGRLEALLTFQTMVTDLTGLDIANASLLDEGTAAAEGMAMARRAAARGAPGGPGERFVIDADTHPQTIDVVATRARALGLDVVVGDPVADLTDDTFGVLLSYPTSTGGVRHLGPAITAAHEVGAITVVAADLLALTLLASPGAQGADIAVGSTQRFGVPMWFGGPHAGYIAARESVTRQLPGRLVGVSVDAHGNRALRLALQTREQHIRREKATSNVCTAQSLPAIVAAMYACYHGPEGLRAIAERVHRHASRLADGLETVNAELAHEAFFDTVTARVPGRATAICDLARTQGLNLRHIDSDTVGVSVDETTDDATVDAVLTAFGADPAGVSAPGARVPQELRREDDYLTHEVFHSFRSETAMMRELRRLSDQDLALDRTSIPLGSCTMKLNAAAEMEPISWPEFTQLHPFAPVDQAEGYLQLIGELEDWLVEITGYDTVSLQPNAGAQGEFAGLLAIKRYHEERGDDQRDVCLIPESAHGTNAASAAMVGMRVVVVACDTHGNVDLGDLEAKLDEHADRVAAIMVTYPSTHGVFEESITDLCRMVHEHGGQVYLDGANLNALCGLGRPGEFGADVSHLNLHKTFCIPHGGGGPGVGPVAARAHLAPYLPTSRARPEAGPQETGVGAISAAPWGSAGILPISWAYIAMMGDEGLTRASEVAILAANYVARRLSERFPILYTGPAGTVAHECIVDIRPVAKESGITAEDIAKRLIDHGIHAPTMSFPVAGTLMVEPTESEPKEELDRFCAAMLQIADEVDAVRSGAVPLEDSPLRRAPHTASDLLRDDWDRPYSRDEAAHPVGARRDAKYWPPVARIDNAYGDKHLVCTCPPVTEQADA
ncbi:glycine dehydrogenase (aminomethyl-transferring) [Egibacter rhizosphaerae]|uniref:Glycine dehydrogenase (decarboxylating) n=1 Tax=Egibacter rhizosphaerae TaxID=1670831 RepID=A0A411YF42_9ACTN|nr:aminomethyl-transferring glycine dehydrogenase [Egibacter rhizosphaerae]QBI19809.1 glycine dehydrogenase (aminomethyl-transferring) [Egibacter rhizosphaerae]